MGLALGFSRSDSYKVNPVNPNPAYFRIVKAVQVGSFVIAEINYPGCTNYEGNKLLVFKDYTVDQLQERKKIDPHFTKSSKLIARFQPTKDGWKMALALTKAINDP